MCLCVGRLGDLANRIDLEGTSVFLLLKLQTYRQVRWLVSFDYREKVDSHSGTGDQHRNGSLNPRQFDPS